MSTTGGLTLSRKLARGAATARQLEDAFHSRPAGRRQGRAGGEGRLRGAHRRASAPSARSRRSTSPRTPIRRRTSAGSTPSGSSSIKDGGKNLVVSRRALLEEEQRARADEVRRTIVAGAVMTGRVASVREFGAFVDLGGGVQGLLHVSEMGWSRVVGHRRRSSRPATRSPSRCCASTRQAEDLARAEAAHAPIRGRRFRHSYEVGQVRRAASRASPSSARSSSSSRASKALAHASTFPPTGTRGRLASAGRRRA